MLGIEHEPPTLESSADGLEGLFRTATSHAYARIAHWLQSAPRFFELSPQRDPRTLPGMVERLGYHNCQIWNYEDDGRSSDDALVVTGWRGAQANNQGRNETINRIDSLFRPLYRAGSTLHSETVGSLLDRASILCIKQHKFAARDPSLGDRVADHLRLLTECGVQLVRGIAMGRIACLELPRLKLYFDGGGGE